MTLTITFAVGSMTEAIALADALQTLALTGATVDAKEIAKMIEGTPITQVVIGN
jgi:hypothetical protein